jgi:hypothetical protein
VLGMLKSEVLMADGGTGWRRDVGRAGWQPKISKRSVMAVAYISGKWAFGQALLVPAIICAGTKGLATSPQIRPPARQPLVPVTNRD